MGYEDNEQEIDLKEMFFYALYKWRSLLIAGLIGAVLLGAYQCYSIVSGSEKLQKAIEEGTVVEDDYDSKYLKAKSKLESKESERREQSKKSTEVLGQINTAKGTITIGEATIEQQTEAIDLSNRQIERTEALIDEIQSYLDGSVLMQVAEDKPFAKAVYQVKLENEPSAESYIDPADQVVASYTRPMNGSKEIQQLLEKYSLTSEQLDELYSVGSDVSSNRVTVWAVGRDRAMAEDILKVIGDLVAKQRELIEVSHTLDLVLQEYSQTRDTGAAESKNQKKKDILKYQNSISEYKGKIVAAKAAVEQAGHDIENAKARIDDLEKEKAEYDEKAFYLANEITKLEKKMPSMLPSLATRWTTIVKFMLIGFVAGAALLFVIYIAIYVLKPMLRMPNDIRTVYGYPVLGVLNKKVREKVCAIDKWIMKAEGRGQRPGDDEIIKTVAVSIANTAESGSTVALMTTLKENKSIEQITEQIRGLIPGMQFKLLTEGVSKAANVDELSRCDAAVLLEERNATSMGKLTADVNQIRLFGKKVLGAIVL